MWWRWKKKAQEIENKSWGRWIKLGEGKENKDGKKKYSERKRKLTFQKHWNNKKKKGCNE